MDLGKKPSMMSVAESRAHQEDEEELHPREVLWVENTAVDFIHWDESDILPIPVLSNTSPLNAQECLIRAVLSLGRCKTELGSSRDCLREVGLIGSATDQDSLKQYSEKIDSQIYRKTGCLLSKLAHKI